MKFKKYASKKIIAIVMVIMLAVGGFANQQRKIDKLQEELYIQQNMTDQHYNYTETIINTKTLKEEFNKICEYKILDGKINIKHKYVYQGDSILGLKSKFELVGTADFYYEFTTNLKNVTITKATEKEIVLQVDMPTINEKACHRVANTFVRMSDECSYNWLLVKEYAEKATRQWEDTFDIKGLQHVKDYYSYADIQNDIKEAITQKIKALLEELGYSQSLEVLVR